MDAALKAADGNKTNKAYTEAKDAYYRQKAVFETVDGLVSKAGGATKEADAKIDAIKFKRDLTAAEIDEIKSTIVAYQTFNSAEAGTERTEDQVKADKKTGDLLLQKFEEDAQFEAAMA
jgi:hypothetical protein